MKTPSTLRALLLGASFFAAPCVQGATYYWDQNSTTAGFGTAGGTWDGSGGSTWGTLDGTGAIVSTTTTTADIINFGTATAGLGAGTITVSGAMDSGNITFGAASGAIVLSGGSINLAAASTITVNNATNTISSSLTGAGTSFTKAGTGTLILTEANTYTGTTIINRGSLVLNRATGSLDNTTPLTFSGTGTFNMDNVGAIGALTQTLGALTFSAGEGTVRTTRTADFDQAITFASLAARTAGATGNFVNTSTNSATNGFIFTTAPTAGALIDRGIFYNGSSFATYDAGGFVRGFTTGDTDYLAAPTATTMVGSVATSNVDLTTGNITAQTTVSANTINMRNFNIAMTGTSAVLSTNGLLSSGSSTATLGGGTTPRLQAGSAGGELVVRVNGGSDQLTISSVVQNNTSASLLTKSGEGTLVLSSANTYTGATSINAGTVQLGNATALGSGAVTVANGARINLNGQTVTNALTLNGSGISNGGALTSAAGRWSGAITLGSDSSIRTTGAGAFQLGSSGNNINTNGFTLTLGGGGGGSFQISGNGWGITGGGSLVVDGVYLSQIGGGVASTNTYSGSTTLINGAGILHFSNNISTNATLVLNGGWIDGYANSGFTRNLGTGVGQIQIIGGASGFGTNGNGTINLGASATWGSSTFNPSSLIVGSATSSAGTTTFSTAINLNGADRTIASNGAAGSANGAISGIISNGTGTAGLIKTGVGTLILSGVNTYNGSTTISAGTLQVAATTGLGNSSTTNTLIFNGGTLQATGAITSVATRGVTMTATGIIDNNTFAISIAGNISGAGGLTKNGAGTLTLSGTNSYGGITTVNAGTLQFANEVSLYNSTPASWTAANLNVKSGATLALNVGGAGQFTDTTINTLLTNISVANAAAQGLQGGAILGLDTTGGTFTQGNAITNSTGAFGGTIGLTKLGTGALILDQANTYTGVTTVSGGTLQLGSGTATGSLSGSGIIGIGTGATFAVNQTDTVTQGTDFGFLGGLGGFTQAGSGTTVLNQANTFSGTTTVSAGTLTLSNALALQNSALVTTTGTSTMGAFSALTLGGLSGSRDLGSADVLFGYTGNVSALTLNPQSGVSVTYSGVISDGSGAMSLTKTGAGTQILTGVNTYTGATIVNAGTLTIGAGGSLSSSSALQINGGTFINNNNQTLNGFAVGAGNSTLSNNTGGTTLTLGAITRTAGLFGTVNFATLTGAISTTTGITNGIIGAWATTGSTTTLRYAVGSPDGSTPTNISAFTGTAGGANLVSVTDATVNYEYSAAVTTAANLTGNTLRYSGAATATAIGATNTLTLNGLMQAGTGLLTISGGPTTGGILIGSTGELVIVANAQATTISAAIAGTGRLVYSGGAGALSLSSLNNAYNGGTVINSGTVTLTGTANTDVNAVLGNTTGGITLNGGQLRMAGVNVGASATTGTARIVTVNGVGSSLFVNKNNYFATTGKLTGDGTLSTLDGGGNGTLSTYSFNSTANDYTGRLIGTNTIMNVNSFANSTNSIVLDGATFNYGTGAAAASNLSNRAIELSGTTGGATITNSNTTAANTLSIGGGLVFTGIGNKTLTLAGVNTGNNSFSGNITNGPGSVISLTKSGTGTWVIGGNNTFTGATNISAAGGRLSLNNLNAIANSSSVTVASGGTLGFAIAGTYATAGTINIAGVGATLPGGAGALWFGQGGSYASTLNATINMTAAATIGSFGNVMTQILGGAITGTGALTIQSQGGTTTDTATWNLNAASTYSGNTIFTTSGGVRDMTVKLGVHDALPTTTSLNLQSSNSQAVNSFTTFDLNGFNQTLTGLTDTGGTPPAANNVGKRVINSSGTLSTLTINNAGAVTYGTSGTRILAGTIGGLDASGAAANNLALTKTGAGVLTLASNASSFTGNILISNGTLTASVGGLGANPTTSALGNTQTVGRTITVSSGAILNFSASDVMGNGGTTVVAKLIANGGTIRNTGAVFNMLGAVDLNGGTLSSNGGSSATFPSFALGGTVTVGGSAVSTIISTGANSQIGLQNAGTTFNVGNAVVGSGNDLNVTGVLAAFNSGTGALIKSGAGTMILAATNTYTGVTNVNAGTLLVNGSISSSSLTTVASTATIGGSGTVGALTVSSGGFISGGDSAGDYTSTLNINGAYSQAGQYTAHIDGITAGNFDQLNVTGAVDITGGSLVAAFSGSYSVNDLIFILLNDGGDAITGTYAGLAQGATVLNYGGFDWSISYEANSAGSSFTGGNDIALQAVLIPEPKTALLGCLGVLLLLRRRR